MTVAAWVTVWFGMMCWEVYDQHADHVVIYSLLIGWRAHAALHRT